MHLDRLAQLLIETKPDEQGSLPVHLQLRALAELL
jgi:hypothetical protein